MTTKSKLPKDHALVPTNAVDLERVRERCRKLVRNKALRSAGMSALPIPGVDLVSDLTMFANVVGVAQVAVHVPGHLADRAIERAGDVAAVVDRAAACFHLAGQLRLERRGNAFVDHVDQATDGAGARAAAVVISHSQSPISISGL